MGSNLDWIEALAAKDWPTRSGAIDRLARLGSDAAPALIAGAAHPEASIRAESVALMDHLADADCIAALEVALRDESARVRRLAVHSIGCQRCKVAPLGIDVVALLIERAARDPSPRVRQVATHQLGLQPSDPRALAALEEILRHEPDAKVRSRAEHAIRGHRPTA